MVDPVLASQYSWLHPRCSGALLDVCRSTQKDTTSPPNYTCLGVGQTGEMMLAGQLVSCQTSACIWWPALGLFIARA